VNEVDEAEETFDANEEAAKILQALRDTVRAEAAREAEHDHRWKVIGINRPEGQTPEVHPRALMKFTKDPITNVLLRCIECGWIVALVLPGHWSVNEIMGLKRIEEDDGSDTTAD
jgi:hypothetical protein